jgi:hypothetical protein
LDRRGCREIDRGWLVHFFPTALVRLKFTGKISCTRRANPVPRRFTRRSAYGPVNEHVR